MSLLDETIERIKRVDNPELAAQIQGRLDRLTKPRGSLGRLEEIALQYGLARGTADLRLTRKAMFVFCADHGVTAAGVSAYPREVTRQMVLNFISGGAAINVLCRQHAIDARIVDIGVDGDFDPALPIIHRKIARGTQNFLEFPAMTSAQAVASIETGIRLAQGAAEEGYDLLGAGEMGIGNTTATAAVVACLTGRDALHVAGRGTGITDAQLTGKVEAVRRALALRDPDPLDPVGALAAVGGFEIGGIAGLLLGAAASRLAVAVDGYIASTGALIATRLAPNAVGYLFFSHRSTEPGHAVVLDTLPARPLLSLDLRLGEGTGAALAVGLIESAVRLYNEMATFESAQISGAS